MNANEIKQFILKNTSFTEDRYGNLKLTSESGKEYRLKFQDRSVRFETKITFEATTYSPAAHEWFKLDGDYYSKIHVLPDGRLKIGKKAFGKKG